MFSIDWLDIFIAPIFIFLCIVGFGCGIMVIIGIANWIWGPLSYKDRINIFKRGGRVWRKATGTKV